MPVHVRSCASLFHGLLTDETWLGCLNELELPVQQERLRVALERSMVEQHLPSRRRSPLPAPREDSDPELRRALQASLEEERLRRCMMGRGNA